MRLPTLRSKYIIATGIFASSLLLVACSDSPTGIKAPSRVSLPKPSKTAYALVSHQVAGDTAVSLITLDTEQEDSFLLPDGARISFPAHSVCDVAGSSYGAGEWDQPCEPQQDNVVITVRSWSDSAGRPRLDFQPAMRFNPAAGPVVLSLVTPDPAGTSLAIRYCPEGALAAVDCVDESLADADLVTYLEAESGTYFRRVKHFSGYNLASGRSVMADVME
jgi:hypothetical protein